MLAEQEHRHDPYMSTDELFLISLGDELRHYLAILNNPRFAVSGKQLG